MDSQQLAAVGGILLALGFSYIPGLNEWYAGLSGVTKRLIMLALMFAVGAGAYGLACANIAMPFGITLTCDQAGLISIFQAFVAAAIANQTTYMITPDTQGVKAAVAKRDALQKFQDTNE
jgi:hypothetical protein